MSVPIIALFILSSGLSVRGQEPRDEQKAGGKVQPKPAPPKEAKSDDPFAGVTAAPSSSDAAKEGQRSWRSAFFRENFGFRKEIMSQFNINEDERGASRQSVGFEVLKKFSTETSTVASFNFQGRLVRRDGFVGALNDMEGERRSG